MVTITFCDFVTFDKVAIAFSSQPQRRETKFREQRGKFLPFELFYKTKACSSQDWGETSGKEGRLVSGWSFRRDSSLPVPWGKEWQNQKPQASEGSEFQGFFASPHPVDLVLEMAALQKAGPRLLCKRSLNTGMDLIFMGLEA